MGLLESLFGDDASVFRDTDFQVLLLANVMGPLGGSLVTPLLESLTGPFGVSVAEVGLMMSVFSAPGILMIPLAGAFADRYGRKPVLIAGILLYSLPGMAIAATTDFRFVLALRFLQGMGFAGVVPVVITSIGDLYAGAEEATAQGFRFMGSGLVQVVFPPLAGVLVAVAWYYPFLVYAIGIPIAIVAYVGLEEPRDLARTDGGPGLRVRLRQLRGVLRNRRVVAFVVARGLPVVTWIAFLTYNSVLVARVLGGTPSDAGLIAAVGSLVTAASASQAGRLTAFFDSRLTPLAGSTLCLGAGLAGFAMAPSMSLAAASIALCGFGFGIAMSMYRSIITTLPPAELRGSLVSVGESFGRVTATATPVLMGATVTAFAATAAFSRAIRWTILLVALGTTVAGLACLGVAHTGTSPTAS